MPYYNEQDLEDFVDYLDNDTQTEDLSDSEDEIEMNEDSSFDYCLFIEEATSVE